MVQAGSVEQANTVGLFLTSSDGYDNTVGLLLTAVMVRSYFIVL